jgi:hypothetical protein
MPKIWADPHLNHLPTPTYHSRPWHRHSAQPGTPPAEHRQGTPTHLPRRLSTASASLSSATTLRLLPSHSLSETTDATPPERSTRAQQATPPQHQHKTTLEMLGGTHTRGLHPLSRDSGTSNAGQTIPALSTVDAAVSTSPPGKDALVPAPRLLGLPRPPSPIPPKAAGDPGSSPLPSPVIPQSQANGDIYRRSTSTHGMALQGPRSPCTRLSNPREKPAPNACQPLQAEWARNQKPRQTYLPFLQTISRPLPQPQAPAGSPRPPHYGGCRSRSRQLLPRQHLTRLPLLRHHLGNAASVNMCGQQAPHLFPQ